MSIALDTIIVVIIIATAILSAKRGFIFQVVKVSGFVIAVILSIALSYMFAGLTYNKIIEPRLLSLVSDKSSVTAEQQVADIWEELPPVVKQFANAFDITQEKIVDTIADDFNEDAIAAAELASEKVVGPAVTRLLAMLYAVILLIILLIIVGRLAAVLNKRISFRMAGKLNYILGGGIGAVKGMVFAVIFCLAVQILVAFTGDVFFCFTKEAVDGSFFFGLLPSQFSF